MKEVREKMQTAAVAVQSGDYFEPSKMTVGQWLDLWLKEYSADWKYKTKEKYETVCRVHLKPALGAVKLSKLTTPQIQSFYNELGRTGKVSRGKDKKTVRREPRLAAGGLWQGWQSTEEMKTALVFVKADGSCITAAALYQRYKHLAEEIGVPGSRVHDLRHTFAMLSLQNGDNVKTVQDNLGHATAAFTLDVYGHVSEKMKEDSAARMQRYIENMA